MSDPIAYMYNADTHCVPCALKAFGPEPDRPWVREDATDADGNPVGAISPWDEWCDLREPGHQVLACGTCGAVIAEHDHELPECDCDACTAMAEFDPSKGGGPDVGYALFAPEVAR